MVFSQPTLLGWIVLVVRNPLVCCMHWRRGCGVTAMRSRDASGRFKRKALECAGRLRMVPEGLDSARRVRIPLEGSGRF